MPLPKEPLAHIHFCVMVQPGEAGMLSGKMKNPDSLPPELKAGIHTMPGARYRFACSLTKVPDMLNGMSDMACAVTCERCRKTNAWVNAPDTGPYPKDPAKGYQTNEETEPIPDLHPKFAAVPADRPA